MYAAADGMLVQSTRTDLIAGNLAGASAAGFKRDVPVVRSFERVLEYAGLGGAAGTPGHATLLAPSASVDLTAGALKHTGAELDIALEGSGYLCVQTPGGEALTRGGALQVRAGLLVTISGEPALGQAGPIRIAGAKVEFVENGDVMVDGARTDRLKLVDLAPGASVTKLGRGLLHADSRTQHEATGVRVRQGYLEAANVDVVSEMVGMISALRAFEASQRALQANDQTLDKAINEIARV
jgi:flagellar basal-body rod protein FlgG